MEDHGENEFQSVNEFRAAHPDWPECPLEKVPMGLGSCPGCANVFKEITKEI